MSSVAWDERSPNPSLVYCPDLQSEVDLRIGPNRIQLPKVRSPGLDPETELEHVLRVTAGVARRAVLPSTAQLRPLGKGYLELRVRLHPAQNLFLSEGKAPER